MKLVKCLAVQFIFLFVTLLYMDGHTTAYWNASAHGRWNVAANWQGLAVPSVGEAIYFDGDLSVYNCSIDVDIDVGVINFDDNYTGHVVQQSGKYLDATSIDFESDCGNSVLDLVDDTLYLGYYLNFRNGNTGIH